MVSNSIEEELLQEDIGGNKRQGKRKSALNDRNNKKLKIDTTQYDEDSSSDEDASESESLTKQKVNSIEEDKNDSDSDMFSDDDNNKDEPVEIQRKKKSKGPQPLSKAEIEKELGIDETYTSFRRELESESEDESNQPQIEAFNVNNEMRKGHFDVNGNYIQTQLDSDDEDTPHGEEVKDQDQWYKDFKKQDIVKAKNAQLERQSQLIHKSLSLSQISTEQLLSNLITTLKPAETSMDAFQRLNKGKLSVQKFKKATYDQKMQEKERSKTIMLLTEWCEGLLNKAIPDVYELEREELMGLYQRETGEKWKDTIEEAQKVEEPVENNEYPEQRKWQFKWDGDEVVNGPYTNTEMNYWKENYFQGQVQVKLISEEVWMPVIDKDKFV